MLIHSERRHTPTSPHARNARAPAARRMASKAAAPPRTAHSAQRTPAHGNAPASPHRFSALPPVFVQDFKGQLYNERLFQILVILFGLVGFVVGYFYEV